MQGKGIHLRDSARHICIHAPRAQHMKCSSNNAEAHLQGLQNTSRLTNAQARRFEEWTSVPNKWEMRQYYTALLVSFQVGTMMTPTSTNKSSSSCGPFRAQARRISSQGQAIYGNICWLTKFDWHVRLNESVKCSRLANRQSNMKRGETLEVASDFKLTRRSKAEASYYSLSRQVVVERDRLKRDILIRLQSFTEKTRWKVKVGQKSSKALLHRGWLKMLVHLQNKWMQIRFSTGKN